MANTYFQFKQFLINQEKSGMKVTTDGCLFGGWIAEKISKEHPKNILDIGTGTGLLSLMLAQVAEVTQIDALEINKDAFEEASHNFQQSPWTNRLNCIHTSLQKFETNGKYDLIICNPPFFSNNQKGEKFNKNQALHSDHLSINELTEGISKLIRSTGSAYVLYPEREMNEFIKVAEKENLFLNNLTIVKNRTDERTFRFMGKFSSFKEKGHQNKIIIRDDENSYTKEFWHLVKDYYL